MLMVVCDNPLEGNDHIAEYEDRQGKRYSPPSNTSGHITIPVLEFLNGLPLTNLTLAYCHGLRPSEIRVSNGAVTTDGHSNRITILVGATTNLIESITMEVDCLYASGYEVRQQLEQLKRKQLEQVKLRRKKQYKKGA